MLDRFKFQIGNESFYPIKSIRQWLQVNVNVDFDADVCANIDANFDVNVSSDSWM